MTKAGLPVLERIALRSRVMPNGCIEWTGHRRPTGYGLINVGGRIEDVHRVVYRERTGEPIPEGLYVCHNCDNPPCCNFDHLFLGTPQDNMTDMLSKGRGGARGAPGRPRPWRRPSDICAFDGCEREHSAKGYCSKHYNRFRKYGDPLVGAAPTVTPCSIEGCGRRRRSAVGYCEMHWKRFKRSGAPGEAARRPSRWGGD